MKINSRRAAFLVSVTCLVAACGPAGISGGEKFGSVESKALSGPETEFPNGVVVRSLPEHLSKITPEANFTKDVGTVIPQTMNLILSATKYVKPVYNEPALVNKPRHERGKADECVAVGPFQDIPGRATETRVSATAELEVWLHVSPERIDQHLLTIEVRSSPQDNQFLSHGKTSMTTKELPWNIVTYNGGSRDATARFVNGNAPVRIKKNFSFTANGALRRLEVRVCDIGRMTGIRVLNTVLSWL